MGLFRHIHDDRTQPIFARILAAAGFLWPSARLHFVGLQGLPDDRLPTGTISTPDLPHGPIIATRYPVRTPGTAFWLWATLRSCAAHWMTTRNPEWPSIQTLADICANKNRHRILGRAARRGRKSALPPVLALLLGFGLLYDRIIARLKRTGHANGYDAVLAVAGIAATLAASLLLNGTAPTLRTFACFAASGTPLALGSMWRYAQKRARARGLLSKGLEDHHDQANPPKDRRTQVQRLPGHRHRS